MDQPSQAADGPPAPVRPRIFKACQRCRAKKIKCDGRLPRCAQCMLGGVEAECVYSETRKTRGAGKSQQRLEDLQQRLLDVESLLRRSELTSRDPSGDVTPNTITSVPVRNPSQQILGGSPLTTNGRTLGNATTHFKHFANLDDGQEIPVPFFVQARAHNSQSIRNKLRARAEHINIINFTADMMFEEFPLFPVEWFRNRVQQPDMLEEQKDVSWCACLNALMALAMRLKAANSSFEEVTFFSWNVFQEAYAALPQILSATNSEAALQAVLAMILFLRTTADLRLTTMLLSMAVKMCQLLQCGLFNAQNPNELSAALSKSQKRLCWITWVLDSELSLNQGLPPTCAPELSNSADPNSEQLRMDFLDNSFSSQLFCARAELAVIQCRISPIVNHDTRWARQESSEMGLLDTAKQLDSSLKTWLSDLPADLKVGSGSGSLAQSGRIKLQMAYNNSLSIVHWPAVRHGLKNRFSETQVDTGGDPALLALAESAAQSRIAARSTIRLFFLLETLQLAELWPLLCYGMSASIALLACILREPSEYGAKDDKKAIKRFGQFVKMMVEREECNLQPLMEGCKRMAEIAEAAIDEAQETIKAGYTRILSEKSMLNERIKTIANILCSVIHPTRIAQSLMGNMNDDASSCFLNALGLPGSVDGYGAFVPQGIKSGI